ncbi:MAG: CRISPR-associated protein Cas4 [Candidatus Aminicenantes bacterium]|nr:CRISPR-associated protein Cas4 [Candidatus Aminicenantes bacterium]
MNFSENKILISASQLIEYWYCPRFIYFMNVLGIAQYEEKRIKVLKGREVHEKKALQPGYLRKKLGVIRQEKNIYLSDPGYGICGIIDEVLFFEDGRISLLDYKFAYNKHKFKTQFLQSVFYSLLIESHYRAKVETGYVVYTRDKNKIVPYGITGKDRQAVLDSIEKVNLIITRGFYPKGTKYGKRCGDCAYKRICVQ